MAGLRYTGRADVFNNAHDGKSYEKHKKGPHVGKTDVIPGLTKEEALHMMEQSNLHSFEEAGEDLLEKVTKPEDRMMDAPGGTPVEKSAAQLASEAHDAEVAKREAKGSK